MSTRTIYVRAYYPMVFTHRNGQWRSSVGNVVVRRAEGGWEYFDGYVVSETIFPDVASAMQEAATLASAHAEIEPISFGEPPDGVIV